MPTLAAKYLFNLDTKHIMDYSEPWYKTGRWTDRQTVDRLVYWCSWEYMYFAGRCFRLPVTYMYIYAQIYCTLFTDLQSVRDMKINIELILNNFLIINKLKTRRPENQTI